MTVSLSIPTPGAAPVAAAPAAAQTAEDKGHAEAAVEHMTRAFEAGDIDGVLATYEAGAVVVGEPGVPTSGGPGLRALFERFVAAKPKFTYGRPEVIVAGTLALHLMPWSMTGSAPDGSRLEDGGLSIAVLRKQPDGHWLMVIDDPYGDHALRN